MKLLLTDRSNIPSSQLEEGNLIVTFNDEAYEQIDSEVVVRHSEYQPGEIATNEEFDTLREWLSDQFYYEEIDIGPLIQNTFIDLFGYELIRQTKIIKKILQTENPSEVVVYSDPSPVYEWSSLGSSRIISGVPKAVATAANIEIEEHTKPIRSSVGDC